MNPFAVVEAWCSDAVERTFALAFPISLEPVEVARKLVATFESTAVPTGSCISRVIVQTSARDAAHLQSDRNVLETQWSQMLARLAARAGRSDRPTVTLAVADELPRGSANVVVQLAVSSSPQASTLELRVRKGVPLEARFALNRPLLIGRDLSCDVVLVDPRVSRRHLAIALEGETVRFTDLGSANGVLHNGRLETEGTLATGDVLKLGDSELVCEPAAP
ncbi:MAG TPA: FhaA domain-containing protein [Candidatus Acidoferrales bacterium]|nr:FhaA domain-containing protein [Candidatus Acidoferrales bacterium]